MARSVIALAAALMLVSLGSIPATAETGGATPETLKAGIVTCGEGACVHVWQFQCAASNTLHAAVRDTVHDDDTLMVTLVGNLPASIKGKADVAIASPPGAYSSFAALSVPNNTTISGFAIVVNLSPSDSAYEIDLHCHKKDGTFVDPGTITLIQDQ